MSDKPRGNATSFKPGRSGNPGGMPRRFRQEFRAIVDGMMADDPETPGAKIPARAAYIKRAVLDAVAGDRYAREFVEDRYAGKPKQHMDVEVTTDSEQVSAIAGRMATLSAEQLAALAVLDEGAGDDDPVH